MTPSTATATEDVARGASARVLPSRWLIASVATLVMSVSYIDRQTLAAIAPTVEKALAMSRAQYGWALAAFSFAYLVGAPIAGIMLDRAGARRGLVFAVVCWSVVAAAHAIVPSFALLVGLRVLLGVAEAPSFPGAAQTMKRILPPAERSMGIGLLFTGSSLGAMVAVPLATRFLGASGGWRSAFLGTALIGALWVPLWLFVTSLPGVREALATSRSDESGGAESRTATAGHAGVEGAAGEASPPRPLFASAAVWRAAMLVVFTAPCIMFGLNWSSNYMADAFGFDQVTLAHYIWFPPVGFDLGAVVFGSIASRADRRASMAGGGAKSHVALMTAAALLCATMLAMPLARDPWLATALLTSCLAGGGGVFALLTADMLARVHPSQTGGAAGITAAAQSLAYIVANPLVGRAVDRVHSYASVLFVLGAIVLPAAAAWAAWPVSARPVVRRG